MYEVMILLKSNSMYSLKELLRKNNFSDYIFNGITKEYDARGNREIIPISGHCDIQQVYIYNGNALPPAMQEIFKRLEEEDVKHAVVGYSIKYTTR